jgi:hypothetical protein
MSTVGGPRLSTISKFTNTYSMDFDGVDDYLDLGTESTVANGGQFTLSFWIKGNSQPIGAKYLFSADYYNLHTFWTIQNTELYWRNINSNYKLLSTNLLDGDWHHILIIWNPDGANSTIRCFTDGANEVNIATDFRYAPGWNGGAYQGGLQYIGNRGGGTFPGFNGSIDEFAVWNDDQSSNVSTIYNGGVPNDLTDLSPDYWLRNGDNGSWKSPQFLLPNNSNKNKLSNYSFEFDGIDDVIPIRTMASMVGVLDEVSYSCWIRTSTPGVYQDYQCPFGGYSNAGAVWNIGRLGTPYNTTNLVIYTSGLIGTTILNDGNWHHIVSTFNKTTKEGIWYVDGNIEGTKTLPSYLTHFAISIGAGNGTNDYYFFNGNIDECSVWSNVLTQSEVTYLYNNGTPTDLTNLSPYGWYRMGEESNFTSNWLVDNSALNNYSKRSFSFDGIDDRVQLSSDFVASGEFTLSFWMKPETVSITGKVYPMGTFPNNDNYIRLAQIGVLWFRLGATTVIFNESVYGGGANILVLNEWQHITFVRDSSNIIRCYRNGVDFGYNAAAAANSNTLTLNSFGRIITNSFGFGGGLDEIAFWNSDQTSNLATIYNGGTPTTLPSGAVAHYRMGEDASFNGTNWTVPDNAGSNTGTSNAMDVDALVGEAPNYSGGGISQGMTIEDRVGDAPNSKNNAVSLNMDEVDRATDVPT